MIDKEYVNSDEYMKKRIALLFKSPIVFFDKKEEFKCCFYYFIVKNYTFKAHIGLWNNITIHMQENEDWTFVGNFP